MQPNAKKNTQNPMKRLEVEDWFMKNLRTVEAGSQLKHKDMFKNNTGYKEQLEKFGK